jgi:peptidyl-prolyl cis-trans isomerase SurA
MNSKTKILFVKNNYSRIYKAQKMNRIFYSLFLVFALTHSLSAQNDEIILRVGEQEVSKAEFEHIYKKNNNNLYLESDKKTPAKYLDLFINFKLKVAEAMSLKMDTNKAFINELAGYREEIAAPYLTDVDYNEQFVQEMYRRMTHEVNASHILMLVDKSASPKREKEILDKITAIREEIINGLDFGKAAMKYSEDPSAKENKGDLGYFSAFMMVAPFEDAAFNTPTGEISMPVRSAYGYHLIRVNDVRKNRGEIQVAHIMKNIQKDATAEAKLKAKSEIDAIYQQLKAGADFAELAKKESDDKRSAVQGGKMPWFGAGRIVPEFSIASFALENTGDISKPIETKFGFHIIKKLDERTIAPYDELKAEIERKIKSDPARRSSSNKVFIDKLKNEYNFTENTNAKMVLESKNIQEGETLPDSTFFTIDNKTFGTAELQSYIETEAITKGSYLEFYDQWIDAEIIKLENSKLENKYPEFRYLMNEYHDGILLFNISQVKIWDFASKDSVGLNQFYAKNKKTHLWKERFSGSIIKCKDTEVREKAENLFAEGLTIEEVADHLNSDNEVISFETGKWEEGKNNVVDFYVWNGHTPENFDSATTFIRGDKIKPEPKLLDEARGLFISDYQNYLEEKWIKELHKKYNVKINKKLLKTIESV